MLEDSVKDNLFSSRVDPKFEFCHSLYQQDQQILPLSEEKLIPKQIRCV